jgi:hypothetical protein
MTKKKTTPIMMDSRTAIEKLEAIAFSNILDFASFEPDGRVRIFDWEKANEIGAKVSVTVRKIGRGKNAREVRTTTIKMPNKLPALMKLWKLFGLSAKR